MLHVVLRLQGQVTAKSHKVDAEFTLLVMKLTEKRKKNSQQRKRDWQPQHGAYHQSGVRCTTIQKPVLENSLKLPPPFFGRQYPARDSRGL